MMLWLRAWGTRKRPNISDARSEARVFSSLSLSDLLVMSGLLLLAAGGWFYVGPLVLVALGALFLAAGVYSSWPRKER